MLIPWLIVEAAPDADTQGSPYPLKFHRQREELCRLSRLCEHPLVSSRRSGRLGDVLSLQLLRGLSPTYCTSVRQQERSYFRQLSVCIGFQGCWCVSLHAYKSIILAVKTKQPQYWVISWYVKSSHCWELFSCLAVRTRLELATPCVTGMYSNQTELPNRLQYLEVLSFFAIAKVRQFFILTNFFLFFWCF